MKEFTMAVEKIRENIPAVMSFAVVTFCMEFFSLGLLSFCVLREWKEAFASGRDPDVSTIIQKDLIVQDIKPWLYRSLMVFSIRFAMFLFLLPVYLVTNHLTQHIFLVGLVAWLCLLLLGLFLLSVQAMFVHWYSLLYIDGYFSEIDSFKATWCHLKRFSFTILQFSVLEHVLLFASWIVPCLGPVLIHRPIVMVAKFISYEEHRENLLHIAKEAGLELVRK